MLLGNLKVFIIFKFVFIYTDRQVQTEQESEEPCNKPQNPTAVEKEEVSSREPIEKTLEDEEQVRVRGAANEETSASAHLSCLTVQPSRVLCGVREENVCALKHLIKIIHFEKMHPTLLLI